MTTNKPEAVAWEVRTCSEPESEVGISSTYPEWAERDENLNIMPLIRLSEYERLQAECESLRKDAERYRWLRDGNNEEDYEENHEAILIAITLYGDEWDEKIDAAMQGDQHACEQE